MQAALALDVVAQIVDHALPAADAEIDAAIDRARALAAEGRPVCINIHLADSDFREGSISI